MKKSFGRIYETGVVRKYTQLRKHTAQYAVSTFLPNKAAFHPPRVCGSPRKLSWLLCNNADRGSGALLANKWFLDS